MCVNYIVTNKILHASTSAESPGGDEDRLALGGEQYFYRGL